MDHQLTIQKDQITNLSQTVSQLSSNLNLIKPNNSKEVQLITYTLIATAIVGLFVYEYINNQANANS